MGNVKVSGTLTAQTVEAEEFKVLGTKSAGSAILPTGERSIQVEAASATESARIIVTPTTLTDKPLAVTKKEAGRFTIELPSPAVSDITFDWWVVN